MMAKPMKTIKLHSPMIHLLVKWDNELWQYHLDDYVKELLTKIGH